MPFTLVFLSSSLLTIAVLSQLIILTFFSSILKLMGNHFRHNSPEHQILQTSPLYFHTPVKANPDKHQDRQSRCYLFFSFLLYLSPGSKGVWRKLCICTLRLHLNAQFLTSCESLVFLSFFSIISITSSS